MSDKSYKKELDLIKADEQFKNTLKQEMKVEAHKLSQKGAKEKKERRWEFNKYIIASACVCLLVSGVVTFNYLDFSEKENNDDNFQLEESLPKTELSVLTLSEEEFAIGGMGIELYELYEADEFIHNNPYDIHSDTTTLPVYQNLNIRGRNGMNDEPRYSEKKRQDTLKGYAQKMKLKDYEIITDEFEIKLISEICTLSSFLSKDERIFVEFNENWIHQNDVIADEKSSKESIVDNVQKLLKQEPFKALFDVKKVNIDVTLSYHSNLSNTAYVPSWSINISEKSGNEGNNLAANQLFATSLSLNEEGKVTGFIMSLDDTAKKIGNYPIVSLEEAKQRLSQGIYYSRNWFKVDVNKVVYMEMVYHNDGTLDYFMPYYKFYMLVEDDDNLVIKLDDRMKSYAAYYVPAIKDEYIQGLPVNDVLK